MTYNYKNRATERPQVQPSVSITKANNYKPLPMLHGDQSYLYHIQVLINQLHFA